MNLQLIFGQTCDFGQTKTVKPLNDICNIFRILYIIVSTIFASLLLFATKLKNCFEREVSEAERYVTSNYCEIPGSIPATVLRLTGFISYTCTARLGITDAGVGKMSSN